MKSNLLFIVGLLATLCCSSAPQTKYTSLDPNNPIVFGGDYILYQGTRIELGARAFFIDGQLSDKQAADYDYVYNSINKAVKHLVDGSEKEPMVLYIAPNVYWIDDPDDPVVRIPKEGEGAPFGLEIDCEWLRFQGLTKNPENVVLACNRGQTMGAKGNFTMFKIIGNGTTAENVTFGNYCNIDLEYPLKPSLNRQKRGSAIVQAQLVFCRGDKIFARNTQFISRLNLLPFYGGERTLFDRCHFESTDDALAPRGVYLNCTFEFYSSKPFGHTEATGAILLNCDIESLTRGEQYLVKGRGPIAAVDCRMNAKLANYWGWKNKPALEERHYHFGNHFNNKVVEVGSKHSYATVDMKEKKVLNAYRFKSNNQVIYNTYNLLCGNDDWDPMGIKKMVLGLEQKSNRDLTHIPTQLSVTPTRQKIETGKDSITLRAKIKCFSGNKPIKTSYKWFVAPEFKELVKLHVNKDGSCTVIPINENDETKEVVVQVTNSLGLEAASVLSVAPRFLEAPEFLSTPKIRTGKQGEVFVDYKLESKYEDQSLITWYRCKDKMGTKPVEVAVSRFNDPKRTYRVTTDDIGYYLKVSVAPKHLRCHVGEPLSYVTKEAIKAEDVISRNGFYQVDLKTLSTKIQPEVIPGFWTVDCFKPEDTNEWNDWSADNSKDSWYYGPGINGAVGDTGLVQASKGARIRYTPAGSNFGDMKVCFTACPAKTAGQGFSSAKAQYMDIYLKFDHKSMSGYALRLFRTTKYHNAIDCMFVKYENGKVKPIGEAVSTSCYRTPCKINIEVKGNRISAHMETTADYYVEPNRPEVKLNVDMEAEIIPNKFGGFGFQHTGTVRSGASVIKDLVLEW